MKKSFFILFGLFLVTLAHSQKITYAEPDRDDARNLNFEIIGKMNDNILIYKGYRDNHFIALYDNDMKMVDKQKLNLPERLLQTDFLAYRDYFYLFYQYQRRNVVYCMALKINADGKKVGEPIELDTSNINYSASKKIYTVLNSDDKQRIGVVKINTKNERYHAVTMSLFDKELTPVHRARVVIPMEEKNSFLTEFVLDNDGDFAFLRATGSSQNDNINRLGLYTKRAMEDSVTNVEIDLMKLYMDDLRLKVDNSNKHYLVTSFFSKSKRGNVDGLFCSLWNKNTGQLIYNNANTLSDQLRNEAKSENGMKTAFNDFFLSNIIMRKDGGYVIASESVYTSARSGPYNRWDYMNGFGSPYYSPYSSYYYYSSPYGGYYPWWRYNNFGYQVTRYFSDNIAILSFDTTGKMEWANVVRKSQYDDNTDNFLGYGTMTTGSEVHFIFNLLEKRDWLLTDQTINSEGVVKRTPTFKNLDKGYDFMPRFAKQVGSRQLVLPVNYRNYVSFAKIEF
ncbi:hypothetical protein [Deminuibacter soli]|nr:hypothetical protein [Deminuibacter soli]